MFPVLDDADQYARISNLGGHTPQFWAITLENMAMAIYSDLVDRHPDPNARQQDSNESEVTPHLEEEQQLDDMEAFVNKRLNGEASFVNEPADAPPNPTQEEQKLFFRRWDSTVNCHTFARRMINALSLKWPQDLDHHSGNYYDWLVSAILSMQYTSMRLSDKMLRK